MENFVAARGLKRASTSYTPYRPGLWTSVSAGYGFGGESSVNDVARNDKHDNYFWAFNLGVPLTKHQRIKVAYDGVRTNNLVGIDRHNLLIA